MDSLPLPVISSGESKSDPVTSALNPQTSSSSTASVQPSAPLAIQPTAVDEINKLLEYLKYPDRFKEVEDKSTIDSINAWPTIDKINAWLIFVRGYHFRKSNRNRARLHKYTNTKELYDWVTNPDNDNTREKFPQFVFIFDTIFEWNVQHIASPDINSLINCAYNMIYYLYSRQFGDHEQQLEKLEFINEYTERKKQNLRNKKMRDYVKRDQLTPKEAKDLCGIVDKHGLTYDYEKFAHIVTLVEDLIKREKLTFLLEQDLKKRKLDSFFDKIKKRVDEKSEITFRTQSTTSIISTETLPAFSPKIESMEEKKPAATPQTKTVTTDIDSLISRARNMFYYIYNECFGYGQSFKEEFTNEYTKDKLSHEQLINYVRNDCLTSDEEKNLGNAVDEYGLTYTKFFRIKVLITALIKSQPLALEVSVVFQKCTVNLLKVHYNTLSTSYELRGYLWGNIYERGSVKMKS